MAASETPTPHIRAPSVTSSDLSAGQGWPEIEQAVAANYERLSPSQRRVIDRLLEDKRYAAFTAADLARELGVNESTVTRAAQTLGFAGYPDLKSRLRDRLFSSVSERVEASVAELGESAGATRIALRAIEEDIEALQGSAAELVPATFEAVVQALINAPRVFVLGSRGSHGTAEMLGMGLRLSRSSVFILSQTAGDLADQLLELQPGDLLTVFSLQRIDQVAVRALQYANDIGAVSIAVTDHRSNPVGRRATHTLLAGLPTLRQLPSYTSSVSLANAIVTVVALRLHGRASQRLETAEAQWIAFDTHVSD